MLRDIASAFIETVDRDILDIAYSPLSTFIEENFNYIDLAIKSNVIENVEAAHLLDFEFVKVNGITLHDDKLLFQVIVCAEIEIEETICRDREVDCVYRWFSLDCSIEIDDIPDSLAIGSIQVY